MKKLKIAAPQKTNIMIALDAIIKNLSNAQQLIEQLNVYEKRRLRALAAQQKIRNELLRLAYKE